MTSIVPQLLDAPGTHVLVIGVSAYRHFEDGRLPTERGELTGMAQLSSAARSASEFAAWMLNEYNNASAPLSSLRVLLSPSPGETLNADIAGRLQGDFAATRGNVEKALKEFVKCCRAHLENVLVVHVVGHGVQLTKSGSILLLEDCGSDDHLNVLEGAVDMASVRAAFNHEQTAQKQFWFVDACRQRPHVARKFESLQAGLKLDEPPGAARSSAIFYAATTGEPAYARKSGLSLFTEALLAGLGGDIAAAPERKFCAHWHVSTLELARRLPAMVRALAAAERAEQTIEPTGIVINEVLHEYPKIPDVSVSVAIWPESASGGCIGSLRHDRLGFIRKDVTQWPLEQVVEAGLYEVQVNPGNGKVVTKFERAEPPVAEWDIEVAP